MKCANYLSFLLVNLFCVSLFAQDVTFSFANAEIIKDGANQYYEVDVMISSETGFELGSGQLYLNYNADAFGASVVKNRMLTILYPDVSILATKAFNSLGFYQDFILNDNSGSRFSFSWQQGMFGSSVLGGDNVKAEPALLFRIRLQYARDGANQETGFCFESDKTFKGQTFTACGSAGSSGKDCASSPFSQITNDRFDCNITWYADRDGDGFGDIDNTILAVKPPPGFVLDKTDCNDTDGKINPAAPEACDGQDNNCDGLLGGMNAIVGDLSSQVNNLTATSNVKRNVIKNLELAQRQYCSESSLNLTMNTLSETSVYVERRIGNGLSQEDADLLLARIQTLSNALNAGAVQCCPNDGTNLPLNPADQIATGYNLEISPNPFSGEAIIRFNMPRREQAELQVMNSRGQLVRILVSGLVDSGSHVIEWDGAAENGKNLQAGVYLIRLKVKDDMQTIKATLVRN